jgi:Family of unknown function (DUF5706)
VWWHRRPRPVATRRANRADEFSAQPPPTGDIEFIVAQTGDWIRNADVKTGLLLTGLTVLFGTVSGHAHDLRALWTPGASRPASMWFLAGAVILLAVAFVLLLLVLLPRTKSAAGSRYAWPWIASTKIEELERLTPETLRTEGWQQAKQLADIAAFKYRRLVTAVWASAGSVICVLLWSLVRMT